MNMEVEQGRMDYPLDILLEEYGKGNSIMQSDAQEQNVVSAQKITDAQQAEQGEAVVELTQKLEAEQLKTEEYLDMLRRTQADFVNYRRRASQEQGEGRTAAQIALLEQLLPVLDDLKRALEATPPELAHHPWVQGIRLVAKRLMTTLEQMGVQQFGRPGEKFNPRWHEAVMTEARPNMPEGSILHVTRPGYALGERVIRPAQVIVASSQQ
jgi:molecular chaperone GrpE